MLQQKYSAMAFLSGWGLELFEWRVCVCVCVKSFEQNFIFQIFNLKLKILFLWNPKKKHLQNKYV